MIHYGGKSVLAFGGVVSPGDLFVTIMFSNTPILEDVTRNFEELGSRVKEAIEPFATGRIFN